MVHWPEVIMTYDSKDKVLFSADGFGKFGALDVEEDWAYPGGESGKQVYERAMKVLEEIMELDYKNIAIVTHGGTIRVLLAGLLQESQKNRLMFGKCMERGGFTELLYDKKTGRISLERFNDFAHLEGRPECMMRKEE